jgi:hypothetical protein
MYNKLFLEQKYSLQTVINIYTFLFFAESAVDRSQTLKINRNQIFELMKRKETLLSTLSLFAL